MALIVEALAFVVAVAIAVTAVVQMSGPISTSPWLMPLLVGVAMAVVSGALAVPEIRARRLAVPAPPPGADEEQVHPGVPRVAGWLALSAGYAIAVPLTGFEWATIVFLVIALRLFGAAGWKTVVAVSLAVALLIPLVFRHVFFTLVP